eukprot:COSAG06_NODE_2343_length_7038_cov_74.415622_2_plen_397_part_00
MSHLSTDPAADGAHDDAPSPRRDAEEEAEEGVPFDEAHRRHLFAALDAAPAASLDYLADLARSAARLAELFEGYFRERAAAQEASVVVRSRTAKLRASGYEEGDLRQAAADGELERVVQLLELGVEPAAPAETLADWGPLQYTAHGGHARICAVLAEHGANVLATDRNDETALMQAAYWGHAEAVEELERLEILAGGGGEGRSRVPDCVVLKKPPEDWSWDAKNDQYGEFRGGPKSVSIICSAPEFSRCGDEVMVGLFLICDAFGEHVKFGYDWGGSVTAEPADKNPDRVVWDCCHSLACTVGSGAGQCAVRGRPLRGPVDWSDPKSVAGSMWFPKYKTKVMGAIQAEAQRQGIEWIEMIVRSSSLISHHLSQFELPNHSKIRAAPLAYGHEPSFL